ncbi:polymeric immunoglobulin receptor-like isoform X2 [Channa argus]|uniref:polymeric immunoglobulin receptor-like isoform X2 n=1 Tax=Channa argus TaxID=215402 RepID=UPI0029457767|nr:hypothetical protein Q8A73_014508 [Channa argus]
MIIRHILLFCSLSALCGENTGLVNAKVQIFTAAEGRSGTMHCHFKETGSTKFFCKEECDEDNVLVKTDGDGANSGRYSITFKDKSPELGILSVTFTNLTQSDSGRYRCGFGKSSVPDTFSDFEIRVLNEPFFKNDGFIQTNTEGENVTYPCHKDAHTKGFFFCKDPCERKEDVLIETDGRGQSGRYSIEYRHASAVGLYVTITQVKKSDTGWYKCGYGKALSSDRSSTFPLIVLEAPSPTKPNQAFRPPSTFASTATTTATTTAAAATTTTTTTAATTAATTTESFSSSSRSPTDSSVHPEISSQSPSGAPTTSKPNWTLQPFSASTSLSSESSTPSSFLFPESANWSAAAALHTSSATTMAPPSSSGLSTALVFPESTEQSAAAASSNGARPGHFAAACVPAVSVLLLGALLLLRRMWKKMQNRQQKQLDSYVYVSGTATKV